MSVLLYFFKEEVFMEFNIKKEMIHKVIVRAWKDPEFKKLLLSDPKAALKDMHFPIKEDTQVRVVEEGQKYLQDDHIFTIVIPKSPTDLHALSDREIIKAAGAGNVQSQGCSLTFQVHGIQR